MSCEVVLTAINWHRVLPTPVSFPLDDSWTEDEGWSYPEPFQMSFGEPYTITVIDDPRFTHFEGARPE